MGGDLRASGGSAQPGLLSPRTALTLTAFHDVLCRFDVNFGSYCVREQKFRPRECA